MARCVTAVMRSDATSAAIKDIIGIKLIHSDPFSSALFHV